MAIALVQHKITNSTANTTSIAVTVTSTTGGNPLLVATGNQGSGGRTVTSVTDNKGGGSNTYTQATGCAVTDAGEPLGLDCWYCLNPGGGVTSVTVVFSGATGTYRKNAEVMEFSGFTTAAFDIGGKTNVASVTGTDNNGPTVSASGSSGAGIACGYSNDGVMTANPKAGNEYSAGGDNPSFFAFCGLIYSASGNHQPVWTDNSASAHNFASTTALIKESGGGGAPPFIGALAALNLFGASSAASGGRR
jgi:hypothetical protein